MPFLASFADGECAGFIVLNATSKDCADIYVMGIKKKFHRTALERCFTRHTRIWLGNVARRIFKSIQFKRDITKEYDVTNRFYVSVGYKELECFPTLWGECNTCQLYIKYIAINVLDMRVDSLW